MTPGPSPVPSQVREVLSQEIMHHRTDEFRAILAEAAEGLKYVFSTSDPVITLASSGTGAMEAAVANFLSAGDKAICVAGGKFGERWGEICQSYNVEVVSLDIEWGRAPKVEDIEKLLKEHKEVKAVFTTLCETSTATVYDIKGIAQVVGKTDALCVVDAISGLGQDELLTEAWGVDVVVSGSQKGFMLPPGLAFISLSKKAQAALERATLPRYYFDLRKALKSYGKNDTAFTPAVSLIRGLAAALAIIKEEGLEARCKRFSKMAKATRRAANALGLVVFSQCPSASATAISMPESVKSSEIVKSLRKEYGISIAGGQAQLKDKIVRIAHMGWINEQDLFMCFSLLEKVLKDCGHTFKLGTSLEALEEELYG